MDNSTKAFVVFLVIISVSICGYVIDSHLNTVGNFRFPIGNYEYQLVIKKTDGKHEFIDAIVENIKQLRCLFPTK